MSGSREDSESRGLSDWTLVDSQGEVVPDDGDSESSDSSIEVVSVEGEEVVSCRLQRRNLEQDQVVVVEETPSAGFVSEENSDLKTTGEEERLGGNSVPSEVFETRESSNLSSAITDFLPDGANENGVPQVLQTNVITSWRTGSTREPSVDCEVVSNEELKGDDINSLNTDVVATSFAAGDHKYEENRGCDGTLETQVSLGLTLDDAESNEMEASAAENGASNTEQRQTESEVFNSEACALPFDDVRAQRSSTPTPVSFEEAGLSQVAGVGAACSGEGSRSDSDTDSDFVRLDADNIDALVGEQEAGQEERVVIPLNLYRTGSSIGPGFSFLRNREDSQDDNSPDRDLDEDHDNDHDDDTESSTEEGIDDRIESEQSETGSQAALNDAGDLSIFADIGDLPLEAGDVPRNYIHRPNNNLSTVLNVVVVLAAILTMGISLGIIMATDLEIEEWQNAYASQTKRISDLEYQVSLVEDQRLREANEYVTKLEEMRKRLRSALQESDLQSYVHKGFSQDKFRSFLQSAKEAVTDFDKCMAVDGVDEEVCFKALQPYADVYTMINDKWYKAYDPGVECGNVPGYEETFADYIHKTYMKFSEDDDVEKEETSGTFDAASKYEVRSREGESDDCSESGTCQAREHETRNQEEEIIVNLKEATAQSPETQGESTFRVKDTAARNSVALPIDLDIKQLQQSLTREQERALHWQKLYLAERRQRERERENEEWEDERDREMWEKEKEQMDQVECLKKLMSTNLTTLTQHVVKWNVSVFDDFANLSMLLSGVAELQKSVMDSVHKVWEGAEEVISGKHGKEEDGEQSQGRNSLPINEVFPEYVQLYLDQIRHALMNDKGNLAESLGVVWDDIKHGIEEVLSENQYESVVGSVTKLWEEAAGTAKTLLGSEGDGSDGKWGASKLFKLLNDIEHRIGLHHVMRSEVSETERQMKQAEEMGTKKSPLSNPDDDDEISYKYNHDDSPPENDEPHFEDDHSDRGFWSRSIGKVLKKTGKSVRKFGRKIASTWGKVKDIWHQKKPSIFNIAKRFTSKVIRVSTKFTKMCLKGPRGWYKKHKESATNVDPHATVDIHSKCVRKARKMWQKELLQDPCGVLGKFSIECNSDRKHNKRQVKEVSKSFFSLLSLPVLKPGKDIDTVDVEMIHQQFQKFGSQWGNTKLLLKTDMAWLDCQTFWWYSAVTAAGSGTLNKLKANECNNIKLEDNFSDDHCADTDGHKSEGHTERKDEEHSGVRHHHKERVPVPDDKLDDDIDDDDDDDDDDDEDDEEEKERSQAEVKNKKEKKKTYVLDNAEIQVNGTNEEFDSSNWYLERAQYRLQVRRQKERADWLFDLAADREQQRLHHWNDKAEFKQEPQSLWIFEKAKAREHQRKEEHKSDWLFDRADQRRASSSQEWSEDSRHDHHQEQRRQKESGQWFMDQAEDRQHQRDREHQADWVFERAASRREEHGESKKHHHSKRREDHSHKAEHKKHFQHHKAKTSGNKYHTRKARGKSSRR